MFAILVMSAAMALPAEESQDSALMRAEVRDAQTREKAELDERLQELEQQQQASRAIAEKQQQLIEALQAQIKAMQEKDRERSDRDE
jgi:DNA-binding transcriptional MerR regulator